MPPLDYFYATTTFGSLRYVIQSKQLILNETLCAYSLTKGIITIVHFYLHYARHSRPNAIYFDC